LDFWTEWLLGYNDDARFMQKAYKVEFRCEYSRLQAKVWLEKDTKVKEAGEPVPKISKHLEHVSAK